MLGVNYEYTNGVEQAHLNYSNLQAAGLQCVPHSLLSENHIRPLDIDSLADWGDTKCFFKTGSGDLPYDIFAAAFYLVTRYEEYLRFEADAHNRFPAFSSILVKCDVISEPLVNQWAIKLRETLLAHYPSLSFKPRTFEYVSTIDIDQTWQYRHKGWVRNSLGFLRDFKIGKWGDLKDRLSVLSGLTDDSFFNFDWQLAVHQKYNTRVNYFMLLGDYGRFDKNIHHTNTEFRKLIQDLSKIPQNQVGIHPSYHSNTDYKRVEKELNRLKNILNADITKSRQHFLMHQMPETYANLDKLGITEEHTMGYSTHLGFRAGIAAPFLWYDLASNRVTKMRLMPFCAMDITPLHYMRQNPSEAIATLKELMNKVKAVDGLFISLWHNESLSESGRWKSWRKVYEQMIAYAHHIRSTSD